MSFDDYDAYDPTDAKALDIDTLDEALDMWECYACGGVRTHHRGCGDIA